MRTILFFLMRECTAITHIPTPQPKTAGIDCEKYAVPTHFEQYAFSR